MTNARDQILMKLRKAPRSNKASLPDTPLTSNVTAPDIIALFEAKCLENRIEIHHVDNHNWNEKLQEIAQEKKLNSWLLGTDLSEFDLAESTLIEAACETYRYKSNVEECKEVLFEHIEASLTRADAAIAETGTLVLTPTKQEPRLMSLIPSVHVVLLSANNLHSTFQGYVSSMDDSMPTNLLFVSSPSKTADIQQTLAYGAHGPKELVVLLKS